MSGLPHGSGFHSSPDIAGKMRDGLRDRPRDADVVGRRPAHASDATMRCIRVQTRLEELVVLGRPRVKVAIERRVILDVDGPVLE